LKDFPPKELASCLKMLPYNSAEVRCGGTPDKL